MVAIIRKGDDLVWFWFFFKERKCNGRMENEKVREKRVIEMGLRKEEVLGRKE